jgi:hypothetical protein
MDEFNPTEGFCESGILLLESGEVLEQFLSVHFVPILNQPDGASWQTAFQDLACPDVDPRRLSAVQGMEMRRGMIPRIHIDDDSVEARNFRHRRERR